MGGGSRLGLSKRGGRIGGGLRLRGVMAWPPRVGDPLPRAAAAWCVEEKWAGWILAEKGHATEWRLVFHIDASQWERVWEAIAAAVSSAWHYADEGTAPRLVTAYPKPYNRSCGNGA